MVYRDILFERLDGIATITLNRPDKLNTVSVATLEELVDALSEADRDDDVRAVIVTGAGRAFCAGTDLSKATWSARAGDPPPAKACRPTPRRAYRYASMT